MKVLGLKPGHDGGVAFLDDGVLTFSFEAEKDSFPRHSDLTAQLLVSALTEAPSFPDVLAIGGWHKTLPGLVSGIAAGYRGLDPVRPEAGRLLGRRVLLHSGSHERSHIVGSVAMAPFPSTQPLAVLVWEGVIGSFYRWEGDGGPITAHPVLSEPGARYSALFALADPGFPEVGGEPPSVYAGKLMALAGLADGRAPSDETRHLVESLLVGTRSCYPFDKRRYRAAALHNCGVEDAELHRAARFLSDRIFEIFHDRATQLFPPGLPLVIAGGCGLNCDWNTRWHESGHFADVFVPPCTDDSGSAIGSAVDAAMALGQPCSIEWDVYSGAGFVADVDPATEHWTSRPLDVTALSERLAEGAVVAWVEGRCEIGPRALGHRSLLASATEAASRDRLNEIKRREPYRPVAPICLEEDLSSWFDDDRPDPFMLAFRRVLDPARLPAVAHADATARVQSVGRSTNPVLSELLVANRRAGRPAVLCNTSLNFPGRGFVNRMSELLHLCSQTGVADAVVDGVWLQHEPPAH